MRGVKKNDNKILSLPYVFSWNFYGKTFPIWKKSDTVTKQSKDNDTAQGIKKLKLQLIKQQPLELLKFSYFLKV